MDPGVSVAVPREEGLVAAKAASMVILGGSALLASLLPALFAHKYSTNRNYLDYLLRFGGGILLATTFLHLLPEVREGMEELDSGWVQDAPVQLPELLMCIGFFCIYFIEEFAHKLLGHHSSHHGSTEKTSICHGEHSESLLGPGKVGLSLSEIKQEFLRLSEESERLSFDSEDELFDRKRKVWREWLQEDQQYLIPREISYRRIPEDIMEGVVGCKELLQTGCEDVLQLCFDRASRRCVCASGVDEITTASGTPLRAILITLAISIHQVFEGLAVGLEVHTTQVWILTGAIAAHKVVIAMCVGAEAALSPPCSMAALLASFSIATPLGTGLGLVLSSGANLGVTPVLLQGLAAGTLLFVVFFEVLQRSDDGPKIGHFLVTALGFALMLVLLCFFES